MKRGLYGRKIEVYTNRKFAGAVPIYLNVSKGEFTAQIGDEVIQKTDIAALRAEIDKRLETSFKIEWQPIITISFDTWKDRDDKDQVRKDVSLMAERSWIAQKPGTGEWVEASWTEEERVNNKTVTNTGDRYARCSSLRSAMEWRDGKNQPDPNFKIPYTLREDSEHPTYLVAYDESFWAAIVELGQRLDNLEERMIQFLGSAERRRSFAAQIPKLFAEKK